MLQCLSLLACMGVCRHVVQLPHSLCYRCFQCYRISLHCNIAPSAGACCGAGLHALWLAYLVLNLAARSLLCCLLHCSLLHCAHLCALQPSGEGGQEGGTSGSHEDHSSGDSPGDNNAPGDEDGE